MKFMTTWRVREGRIQEAVNRFLVQGDPIPEGLKSLGRWHRTDLSGGVHVVETQDAALLSQYAARWADVLELETVAVVEDAEAVLALSQVSGISEQAKAAGRG